MVADRQAEIQRMTAEADELRNQIRDLTLGNARYGLLPFFVLCVVFIQIVYLFRLRDMHGTSVFVNMSACICFYVYMYLNADCSLREQGVRCRTKRTGSRASSETLRASYSKP